MYIVAITGASGSILGIRLIEELLKNKEEVVAIVSDMAWQIIRYELSDNHNNSNSIKDLLLKRNSNQNIKYLTEFKDSDLFAKVASGSTLFESIIVIPCSMKTLSAISSGFAYSLITRACDVALKEKRKCIIVPRETPINLIHIENMRNIILAGAEILLPVPGFYTLPKSIDDIIDYIIGKTLNLLGKKHSLFKSWEEQ